ncbi:hypothetical protein FJT64_004353 [Amphibalanus amphitrite]|uniref:Replicase polyprotein 1a n=1 Tax=Amphibalanus amphitrite TaxID=1232801 RepID=A0A6A4W3G8_AMPAM|nr:hypothetical protein FJT64_004353 [Amphibalanus amphitrite]
MRQRWHRLLLALPLLLQLADVGVCLPRQWPGFANHNHLFKPFKPKRARFAAPLQGFSNIFQTNGINRWPANGFPSMQTKAWNEYPGAPQRLQPIPLARNHYHHGYLTASPSPAPTLPPPTRRHRFVPASSIQYGKVPTHFMTDAELHGLVCVPASALGSALAEHRDHVTHHRDGSVTTHRTVVAGSDGTTSHSTRITSAGRKGTVVETRTNSSSGVQRHRQSVQDTGTGLVRTSTGSAFSEGRPGLPSHADVITSSSSEGSNSQSRASASGYDVNGEPLPARSVSESASQGLGGPSIPVLPPIESLSWHPSEVPKTRILRGPLRFSGGPGGKDIGDLDFSAQYDAGSGDAESEEDASSSEEEADPEDDDQELEEDESSEGEEESQENDIDSLKRIEGEPTSSSIDYLIPPYSSEPSSPGDNEGATDDDDAGDGDVSQDGDALEQPEDSTMLGDDTKAQGDGDERDDDDDDDDDD